MRARWLSMVLVLVGTHAAHANHAFQGQVSASVGWTSNASGAPKGLEEQDGLSLIDTSVIFTSALARVVQRLSYDFAAQIYFTHPTLDTISNRLDWMGLFLPSKTTDLTLNAYAMESQYNSASVQTGTQLTRTGTETFFSAGLNQGLTWNYSPSGRFTQSVGFTAFVPTTGSFSQTYLANSSVGLHRELRRDLVGGDLALAYYYYGAIRGPAPRSDGSIDPNAVITPEQNQLSGSFLFRWSHDFAGFWSINAGAGVATLFRASDGGGQIWQPAAEAGVHYTHPKFLADLTYTRGLVPNQLVQQTFVSDSVSLRGTLPFPIKATTLALTGSAGYTHYQLANTLSGSANGSYNAFFVDAVLNWVPRPWLTVFTRYSYSNQLGDTTQTPPISSIERHLVVAGLAIVYPPVGAAYLSNRAPVRVDRSDAVELPDLHAPPPDASDK